MLHQDLDLKTILDALAPFGVHLAFRRIGQDDHEALLPAERAPFAKSVVNVRRRSGAARIAARELLAPFGFGDAAIPRLASGAPQWPRGIVGSLAHDDDVAVACIAADSAFVALGIDVEPAVPLPAGLVRIVATPDERRRYNDKQLDSRLLFAIKEAVFKALNPLDGLFLDFQAIEVDLDAKWARTTSGERIALAFTVSPRVVALAFRPVTTSPIRDPG